MPRLLHVFIGIDIYFRKDKELAAMADKLEEEQGEVVKSQKQIKDMAVSLSKIRFCL